MRHSKPPFAIECIKNFMVLFTGAVMHEVHYKTVVVTQKYLPVLILWCQWYLAVIALKIWLLLIKYNAVQELRNGTYLRKLLLKSKCNMTYWIYYHLWTFIANKVVLTWNHMTENWIRNAECIDVKKNLEPLHCRRALQFCVTSRVLKFH